MQHRPPQTELHRHLDISTRPATLLELARIVGLEADSTGLEAFAQKILIREPMASLSDVLARFTIYQKVLDRPEHLERVAYETVLDCRREGTRHVELRFSPSWVCEFSSLGWNVALESFERGIARALEEAPEMMAGLICIASRDYGPDLAAETGDFYLQNRARFLAFDLAGDESAYPCRLFEDALQPVLEAKRELPDEVHITIHAGEAAGPESVWEAIEILAAERIGHGIRAFDDPQLVEYLQREQICLEMCPTSNRLTGAVPQLSEHPLLAALEAGIPATIDADDPGIFDLVLEDEIRVARSEIGLTAEQIDRCLHNAARHTFLTAGGDDD